MGFIWFDNVNCFGNESFFIECGYNGWLVYNCDYEEDVGVICGDLLWLNGFLDFIVVNDINKLVGLFSMYVLFNKCWCFVICCVVKF